MASTPRVKELAERIYVDMVSRLALTPNTPENARPNPESIAKLCFKLAEAFMRGSTTTAKPTPPRRPRNTKCR